MNWDWMIPLLHVGGLFHENFPRFQYFHFVFKLGGIFVAISTKVCCYRDNYCIPQKTSSNTPGLQWLVDFLRVNSSISIAISMIVDIYIPDFKRLCNTFFYSWYTICWFCFSFLFFPSPTGWTIPILDLHISDFELARLVCLFIYALIKTCKFLFKISFM